MTAIATARPETAEARFEELYVGHWSAVRRYVVRRAQPAEVDDAVAETFLVAWRRRAISTPTRPTASKPPSRGWRRAIARFCSRRRRRT